ncbi:MAG: FtsX-like permease family protein, partial [Clostridia bacterium]|nr:FtsX-like permease family protein [Clostridia bacterium]
QQQLDEAKVQLEDARIQLIAGESQIQTLETAINTLLARQKSLEKQYSKDIAANTEKIESIEANDSEGRTFDVIFAQVTVDNASKITLTGMLDTVEEAYKPAIRESIKRIDSKYPNGVEKTFEEYSLIATERTRLSAIEEEIRVAKNAEKQAKTELSKLKKTIKDGRKQYEEGVASYEDGLKTFNEEVEKAEIDIRKAYQKLDDLPDAKWILLDRTSHYSTYMYKANASQMGAIGIAMPILFFLVAALVCLTTMTRLIDEQRGQIGVFRALGFSRLQIISKYVFYTLAATIVGSIIGMALGMAVFPPVIYTAWRLMYDLPAMQVIMPPHIILLCFFSFAGLMTAVTVFVVNKTLSDVPSQLMRPKAPKSSKPLMLEKVSFIWNRLGFTSKITVRNLLRYKGRAAMTIIGVAGCTGLLVLGWGIKDSVQDIVSIQFGEIYNYNYTVGVTDSDTIPELMDALKSDISNEHVSPYMSYASKVYLDDDDPTINVVVVDAREANDMMNFRDADSKQSIKLKNSGVLVNKKFAINNGISEGDLITIESANGLKQQVKVSGIMELYSQHYIYMSEDYYQSIFDENIHYTNIAIRNPEENASQIEFLIKDIDGYESLMDFSSITSQFTSMLSALNYIILVIILTAGALAFVVLINLTQVNISERIREIATLKVLGFHDSEVNSYIFKEVFLLSVIGAVIGMPLGIVEHKFIMNVINMEMIMFGDQVKTQSFIYAFAVTVIFTVIVLLLTRKSLKKIEMIESLKSVE